MSEERFLILKAGYYYRPEAKGYTALREDAGEYTLAEAAVQFPNQDSADQDGVMLISAKTTDPFAPAADVYAREQWYKKKMQELQVIPWGPGRPMETAPKDRPILAYLQSKGTDPDCPYCPCPEGSDIEKRGGNKLCLYHAHGEGLSYTQTGFYVIEWGGAFDDSTWEDYHQAANLPDWWFAAGSDFEMAANPVAWWDLPEHKEGEE